MSIGQLYVFSCFLLTGFSIGLLFDIFRIFRKSFKTNDFITYVQDFIFWILTGIIVLYSIFTFNNGELRGYIFIAMILGVILYLLLLSNYVIFIFTRIIKMVVYPFNIFYNFFCKKLLLPLSTFFKNLYSKKIKIYIKNIKKDKNIKKNAKRKKDFLEKCRNKLLD